ncbi:MAG: hypothetical protein ACI4U9_05490 [Clostridia bacterium]
MENDNLSKFMKVAYKYGKVKDLREAFEEFPVEKEWHEGKIEKLFEETDEEYNIYEIGDIVFVKDYYYSNGKNGQNHLFVIIDQNNIAIPIENFGMLISSNLDKLKYTSNKLIEKDKCNGLKKDSIVKTDVVYKILNSQISFKIGKVDLNKVEEYKKSFYDSIKNNN